MKKLTSLVSQAKAGIKLMFLTAAICSASGIYAQNRQSVTGKLTDEKNNQAVPYANVALIRVSDSTLLRGTVSDENGDFKISPVPIGKYKILATFIGYKPASKFVDVVNTDETDAGILVLQDMSVELKEAVVVGDRVKAKSEKDKTTFFVTKKILDASSTGIDVLKFIPGIQVNIMQNISLAGSKNIQILVDGKERDRSFISQLNPGQIEKIEVITVPPSNYDGNITGALNIILKKERDSGLNGHIYTELPTSGSEIFIRPSYSLNYGFKKWNLYTSYNGEMTYLNIHESINRKAWNGSDTSNISSNQYVRQKDWSHKFHYGFDYLLSQHDVFNFYATFNPYSRELDGTADAQLSGTGNKPWQRKKEDTDVNASTSYSVYYKHNFGTEGRVITLEVNHYNLKAKNSTDYINDGSENNAVTQTNIVEPRQSATSIKTDFTTPVLSDLHFSTGVKAKFQVLQDMYSTEFYYTEKILAAYATISYKHADYDLSLGLRAEKSVSDLRSSFSQSVLSYLPFTSFRYKLNSRQNIQLSYTSSIDRPNIYQLNPYTSINDPYSIEKGNPSIKPELRSNIYLEHSIQFGSNYFSSRLIYDRTVGAMNNLTFINDTGLFESSVQNLGNFNKYGMQFLGTFKVGIATLNPSLLLYEQYNSANGLAKQYHIDNKHNLAFESGLSLILSFKKDLAFSLIFQYASKENYMQDNTYCDALYFVSLEKTIRKKIKLGMVSGIPFTKSFIYRGSDIESTNFSSHYAGTVKMSLIPLWFKLSYQFNSGKSRDMINRAKEEIDNLPKKGF